MVKGTGHRLSQTTCVWLVAEERTTGSVDQKMKQRVVGGRNSTSEARLLRAPRLFLGEKPGLLNDLLMKGRGGTHRLRSSLANWARVRVCV